VEPPEADLLKKTIAAGIGTFSHLFIGRHLFGFEYQFIEPCETASLASGSMRRDPARNPKAPNSVKRTEIWAASNGEAFFGTKAKKAEIMKATQPRRFVNVIHHDKLYGFHCQ
jgi:hypothetical protein